MAKANVPVSFNPVDTRKVEAALARIQSQAKGVNFGKGAESINKLSRPLGKITGQASEFQKSLEASNARVLAFGASVAVINKLSEAFGALVTNTVKVEAAFAKINVILGGTKSEIQAFGDGIFKVAQQTATSFDQVADGALELARQGLGVAESLSRVETALKLVRVAGIDSKEAVAGLTAAIKGFEGAGLTVAGIADKLAEVDTKFAVSTEDLINGLERASASARIAGVSFDELLGVITTVQERTQRGGAVIGNAFKTIFARLGRTDTLKALQDLGISVLDTEGNVRAAVPLFRELATELDKLGLKSVEAGNIIQKVAGVRQRDILISLVEDLNSGQSQFAKSLEVSAGAAGALDAKNTKLNDTLEALINNLTVGGEKLASVLGEIGFTDTAKDLLKIFGDIVNSITDILQGESMGSKFAKGLIKGIGGTLTPGIALVGAIFIKLFIDLAKFGVTSLKQILGINKAAQQQTALQQSILQTLLQNEAIQREIIALEGNKVAQEQLLLKIYTQQAAALARVSKAAATVTPGLFKGGLRGGEGGVTRRGAGGYISAESRDVSRGVGGAPASSKVVSIPNFAFGGGQRGTMVANTSEYFVPNYKGGGDAIFNKDMVKTMGLPGGAKKLNAAGGYIPNFSKFNIGGKSMSAAGVAANLRRGNITQEQATAAGYSANLRGQQRSASKSKKAAGIFDADKAGVVMLVPQQGLREELSMQFKKPRKGYTGFSGSAYGIDGALSKDSKFGKLVGLDNELEGAMADSINRIIGKVYPSIKTSPAPPISPKAAKTKFLKEGGQGAFGAFKGSMFEAIIDMVIGGARGDTAGNLDIKFNGKNTAALNEIFGLPTGFYRDGDYKSSTAQKSKFASQAITARGAVGYIPNFFGGALEEAIARENQAGVPMNQIRVNQSGKLRNAKNPKGLAVTNTRDEPTGAIPNFNKGGMGDGMGGGIGGIFVVQAISGMASSFVDAESAMGKLLTVVTTLTTALFSFQLITPSLKTFQTRLSDTASSLKRTTSTFDRSTRKFRNASGQFVTNASGRSLSNRMGRIKGGLATGGAAAAGFLAGPGGIALGLGAATVALTRSMTAAKDGLKGMAEAIDSIDFSKLSPEGMQGLAETLARQAVKSVDNASKNSNSNLIVNPGEDLIQAFLRDAKSGDDSTRFGDETKFRTGLGLSTRRFLFGGGLVGAADEPTQKRFAAQALAFDQLNAEGKIDETFEEFLAQFERKFIGTIDAVRFDKAITELFAEIGRELPKTAEEIELGRAEASDSLSILDFDSTTIKNAQRAGAASRFKGLSIAEGTPNFMREVGGTSKTSENIVKQQKMAIKLAGDLGRLERERLVANKAILDSQMAQTEASRKLGSELGGSVLKSLDTKTANTAMAKAIETAVKEGKSFEEVLQRIKILREEGEISVDTETELQRITDSYIDQNHELEIQNKLTQDILNKRKEMADMSPLDAANSQRRNQLKELSEDVPKRLADNLESSIGNALDNLATGTYDSIGDVFLNIALEFGKSLQKEINNAIAKSLVESFTGSGGLGEGLFKGIGSAFGNTFGSSSSGTGSAERVIALNSGGLVTGGNGVTDDIPAKLTGGEFVIRKSAVQKYGADFLDRLNNQSVNGMQSGGYVQGADNVRTEKFWSDTSGYRAGGARSRAFLEEAKTRNFFVPGQRGAGEIVGKENLLAFAQQGSTSGATDQISQRAGGASINLEDQSTRLTAFGRRRDSPAKRALQEAQAQALDLYNQSVAEENRVIQENRDAKKARSRAFKQAVVGAFVNAAVAGVTAGLQNQAAGGSFFGSAPTEGLKLPSAGMYDGSVIEQGTSIASIPGATAEISQPRSFLGFEYNKTVLAPTQMGADLLDASRAASSNSQSFIFNTPGVFRQPTGYSNGGLLAAGDSNALLMDGEYVMGAEAASSLGSDTLNSMNNLNYANGGSVGGSTAASSGGSADVGTLNIEINIDKEGGASSSASGSGEEDPQQAREFSKKIKDVVLNVINEEKRVSGSLFTRNK